VGVAGVSSRAVGALACLGAGVPWGRRGGEARRSPRSRLEGALGGVGACWGAGPACGGVAGTAAGLGTGTKRVETKIIESAYNSCHVLHKSNRNYINLG
jgi:hypothetical protein